MPNRVILVTGCQRSGTTMLNLALDSHPDVVGVDEDVFRIERMQDYQEAPEFAPAVALKLPGRASDLAFIRAIPGVRILWCLRDPRAVVASMVRLQLVLDGEKISWAAHPLGAGTALEAASRTGGVAPDLTETCRRFAVAAAAQPPRAWPLDMLVTSAALCWRLKNDLLRVYDQAGIGYRLVVYERLVNEPEAELRALLGELGLKWHDDVLRHHQLHRGWSVGHTDNTRPIDTGSLEKWREVLGPAQLDTVRSICGPRAGELGYSL
jgi:Sulfotransferase family